MHSSIEILHNLIKSKNEFVTLEKRINSNKEFSEKLLWKILKENIEEINEFLAENQINEILNIDFQQELLFELAINYFDYAVSDEFIQYLVATNQPEFIENVSFLKASKNQIIQLERANLKKHLNELDQLEEGGNLGKIIELNSHLEERAMFEPNETAYNRVSNANKEINSKIVPLSRLLKYAAIFILVPSIITFVYLGSKSPSVVTAANQNTQTKTNKTKQSLINPKNNDSLKTNPTPNNTIIIPKVNQTNFEITPSNIEGSDSYGFISKTMNIVVCNLSNQLNYLQNNNKGEKVAPIKINKNKHLFDSIMSLDKCYEYDKNTSLLKLYSTANIKMKDVQFYKSNKNSDNSILQLHGIMYDISQTSKPSKLIKTINKELIEIIKANNE